MKKILAAALLGLVLSACNSDKDQEKKVLDDILQLHEKVMNDDEAVVNTKMKLDTLLKANVLPGVQDSVREKAEIRTISNQLSTADDAMSQWMHEFNADYKGKSHNETMQYLLSQKNKIVAIDSQLNTALKQGKDYLNKAKTK